MITPPLPSDWYDISDENGNGEYEFMPPDVTIDVPATRMIGAHFSNVSTGSNAFCLMLMWLPS